MASVSVTVSRLREAPPSPDSEHWVTAPVMVRGGALFFDAVIIFFGWAFLVNTPMRIFGLDLGLSDRGLEMGIELLAVSTLYLGLTEARRGKRNGQTVGKTMAGIRTVRADGGLRVGPGRSILRALWLALFLPVPFALFGLFDLLREAGVTDVSGDLRGHISIVMVLALLLSASITFRRRAFHDLLLGTAVVHAHAAAAGADLPDDGPAERTPADYERPSRPLPIRGRGLEWTSIAFPLCWFTLLALQALDNAG